MAKEGSREQAETRFQKAQRTTDAAKSTVDDERDAVRKKTARLKAQRLAKNAGDDPGQESPVPKKRKPKPRV